MAELLQLKLYLNVGGTQEEVRRFSCESNIDIKQLNVRIKETFPHLGKQEFVLKWEDEDGDKVDITSQQELVLALQEMKKICSVYKVHVQLLESPWWKQVQKNTEKTSLNSSGEEHPGIICCCCHQQVKGFRYKCVVCPNYDMCGSCEDKAMHPAHDMVRIPTPRAYPPHFFMRLHRLYERCTHSSPTIIKPGCGLMSSPNEQMAKDLLDEDCSDISDVELEVTLGPEDSKSSAANLLNRKRVNSDPGSSTNVAEQIMPLVTNRDENNLWMQETLPSFEELTKSMQDLAERDFDEYGENSIKSIDDSESQTKSGLKMCANTEREGIKYQTKSCFTDNKRQHNSESSTLDKLKTFHSLKLNESTKLEKDMVTNDNDNIDTSESFRNIQQEIESLLAPLTPLPDINSVPKVVKTSDDKEMFVLMNNIIDTSNNTTTTVDNKNSRAGSFEIVENMKEYEESRSMDEWSILGDRQMLQKVGKENTLKEETGNESSETETEDHVDSSGDDDCNGNLVSSDCTENRTNSDNEYHENAEQKVHPKDDTFPQNKWTVRLDKEIKEMENSAIASSKYFSQGMANLVEKRINEDTSTPKNTTSTFSSGSSRSSRDFQTFSRPSTNPLKENSPIENLTEPKDYILKSSSSKDNKSSPSERPRHYNPRIADALDKMIGMGFSDDDGWLTQVLVMKHGDISQVLDILTPVKK